MFFTLSKIIGVFLKAYNLIFFSILIYILLSKSRLYFLRIMSYFFGFLALFVIIIGGFSYIPNYLIWKFENFIEIQKPINPDGIILLGGAFVGSKKAFDLNQVSLGGRAERVVETLRLLNEHKKAKLLFVSNASILVNSGISEAEQAKQFFKIFQIVNIFEFLLKHLFHKNPCCSGFCKKGVPSYCKFNSLEIAEEAEKGSPIKRNLYL